MQRRWTWAGAVVLTGVVLTALVGHWHAQRVESAVMTHYQERAAERLETEVAAIGRVRNALDMLLVDFDAIAAPTPRDFARLTMPLRHTAGIEAAFAAMPVDAASRAAFEASWQQSYPGFAIRYRNFMGQPVLSPAQPSYLPVVYATFARQSRVALGLDLASDKAVAFGALHVDAEGYLMSPQYRFQGGPTTALLMHWQGTPARRQLLGVAVAPRSLIDNLHDGGPIRDFWFDTTQRERPALLYPDEYGNRQLRPLATQEVALGGRNWRLETRLDTAAVDEPVGVALRNTWLAGLALTAALAALLLSWPRRPAMSALASEEETQLRAELEQARTEAATAQRDGVRLRSILDTAGEAVVLIDRVGRVEQFNAAAERMFGYRMEEVLGTDVGVLMPQHARERHGNALANYLSTGQSRIMGTSRELVAEKKGGDAFPIELTLNQFDIDGVRYYVGVIRDVTARKRAERMLFESEYKHRAILDAAHIGIFLLQDGRLRYVNPAFADNFGRKPADFNERTGMIELVAPPWAGALSVALDPERSGGRPTEVLMQREDGTRFYALVTAKPILYDNRPGLAGSLLDISERKAAEEAMLRAEIRNIAILEAIPDLMLQLSADGTVLDCRGRAGGAEFGVAPSVIGHHYRRGLPAEFASHLEEELAANSQARLRTFEYQLGSSGPARDFEARLTPASDGEWLVMVRDISERKRIEAELIQHRDHLADLVRERTAELDALFNASPLPMAFVSQRRYIDVNEAFVRLFGFSRDTCLNASTQIIYTSEESFTTLGRQVYPPLAGGGQVRAEWSFRNAKGETVLCEVLGQAIDPADPIAGTVWLYQDIRERRAAEDALRNAKELAEAASHAKSEFLANMSHELRTPMHAVLSFAELGERKADADPGKATHYFGRIRSSGQRLLQILNDLLDLSKLEAGKMRYEFRPMQLAPVVRDVADEFAPLARKQALHMHLDIAEDLPDLRVDPLRIGQVVRNLVSNAIKFSPTGGEVRLSLACLADGRAELRVEDEGVGIPENELAAIFDKFTQSSKTKTGAGGTGLGLAISREIVDAHEGSIRAENRAEGGARFVVVLRPA